MFRFTTMICVMALTVGCLPEPTARQEEKNTVDRQQNVYSKTSPVPMFDSSLERERIIQLYQARMEATQTWSVWRSNTGMIEGDCPSSGYPLPYGIQLTSPEVIAWSSSQGGASSRAKRTLYKRSNDKRNVGILCCRWGSCSGLC